MLRAVRRQFLIKFAIPKLFFSLHSILGMSIFCPIVFRGRPLSGLSLLAALPGRFLGGFSFFASWCAGRAGTASDARERGCPIMAGRADRSSLTFEFSKILHFTEVSRQIPLISIKRQIHGKNTCNRILRTEFSKSQSFDVATCGKVSDAQERVRVAIARCRKKFFVDFFPRRNFMARQFCPWNLRNLRNFFKI